MGKDKKRQMRLSVPAGKLFGCVCLCVCAHTPEDDSKVNNSCKLSLQVSLTIYDEIKQYEILLILAGKWDVGSI